MPDHTKLLLQMAESQGRMEGKLDQFIEANNTRIGKIEKEVGSWTKVKNFFVLPFVAVSTFIAVKKGMYRGE